MRVYTCKKDRRTRLAQDSGGCPCRPPPPVLLKHREVVDTYQKMSTWVYHFRLRKLWSERCSSGLRTGDRSCHTEFLEEHWWRAADVSVPAPAVVTDSSHHPVFNSPQAVNNEWVRWWWCGLCGSLWDNVHAPFFFSGNIGTLEDCFGSNPPVWLSQTPNQPFFHYVLATWKLPLSFELRLHRY